MTTVNSQRLAVTSKTGANPRFRSIVICLLLTVLLFTISLAEAQQPTKIPRIGYLVVPPLPIRAATRHSGRVCASLVTWRGKTLSLSGDMRRENPIAVPALAAELVRLKVDIMVTAGPPATRSAKEATVTIPIVMTQDSDPVGTGSSPALRDRAGTSLDCPTFYRS